MQNLERKCSDMLEEINAFKGKFQVLLDNGLPSPMLSEDKIMDLETYVTKIDIHAHNTTVISISSSQATLPTGRNLYDRLKNLFHLEYEIRYLFPNRPTFFRYTEADETLRKLKRTIIAEDQWWEDLLEIL